MGVEGESTETCTGEGVLINIWCSNGTKLAVWATLESTVGEFKELVAQNGDVPAAQQRLIYKGRILKDDQTLLSYGLQADHTIHMVRSFVPSAGQTGSNVPNNGSGVAGAVPNSNPLPNPWGARQTNTASRTPSNAQRTAGVGGLGGIRLPGRDPLSRIMSDPAVINQLLSNPAMSQVRRRVFSNPQYMDQILNFNPRMHTLPDSNPQLREMMQNPDFLRQLTSLETMQHMMTLQQPLLPLLNQQQGTRGASQTGDAGGSGTLMNMFGGLGTGGLNVPNNPAVPPEELYVTQLAQLQEMGFFDTQENIRALQATLGNVHAAVERLLNNLSQ